MHGVRHARTRPPIIGQAAAPLETRDLKMHASIDVLDVYVVVASAAAVFAPERRMQADPGVLDPPKSSTRCGGHSVAHGARVSFSVNLPIPMRCLSTRLHACMQVLTLAS